MITVQSNQIKSTLFIIQERQLYYILSDGSTTGPGYTV